MYYESILCLHGNGPEYGGITTGHFYQAHGIRARLGRPEYDDPPSGLAWSGGAEPCFYVGCPSLDGSSPVLACNSGQLALIGAPIYTSNAIASP